MRANSIRFSSVGISSQEEMEMPMFDRFQIILPTLYHRRWSHARPGSDDHLFSLAHLDDIMSVSYAKDSLVDWHYRCYDGHFWVSYSAYRECEYEGVFGATAAFVAVEMVFIGSANDK
jgi:hypothetical protein